MNKLFHLLSIWLLMAVNLLPLYLLFFSPLLHELHWKQILCQYLAYLKLYAVLVAFSLFFLLRMASRYSVISVHHYFFLQLDLITVHPNYVEVKRSSFLFFKSGFSIRFARHLPIFIVRNARMVYLKNDAGSAACVQLHHRQFVQLLQQLVKGGFMYFM